MDKEIVELLSKPALSIWPDTAKVLGVSRSTVYEMARQNQLPTILISRRKKVPSAALKAMLGITDAVA